MLKQAKIDASKNESKFGSEYKNRKRVILSKTCMRVETMESLNKIEYKMTNFNRVETRIEYKRK